MDGWGTVAWWRRTSSAVVACMLTCAVLVPAMRLPAAAGAFVLQGSATGRIAAGSEHTCAITDASDIKCWGSTAMSQFPTPAGSASQYSTTPAPVAALGGGRVPVQISAGDFHTCVVADDGTVWCWGYGGSGAISGAYASADIPQQVTLEAAAREVGAGGQTSCAVLVNDTVWCWGKNNFNQLGAGPGTTNSATPMKVGFPVSPLPVHVAVGSTHACAVMADGTLWCWGNYGSGRLGTTAGSNATTPSATASLAAAASVVAAGYEHTCAVLAGGRLTCFGNNADGQLGVDTSPATFTSTPTATLASGAARVSAGEASTCVLGTSSAVTCTGAGYSGLQQMTSLAGDEVDVVSGAQHSCAVAANGQVRCWGANGKGQLGTGDRTNRTTPTLIGALTVTSTTTTTSSSSSSSTTSSSTTSSVVAVTSTSTAATDVPTTTVAAPKYLRLRVGRTVAAVAVVKRVGFTVPKKSQGTVRVSIVKGARFCGFAGTRIKGLRAGSCRVRVMRIPKRGSIATRYIVIRVVR